MSETNIVHIVNRSPATITAQGVTKKDGKRAHGVVPFVQGITELDLNNPLHKSALESDFIQSRITSGKLTLGMDSQRITGIAKKMSEKDAIIADLKSQIEAKNTTTNTKK